MTNGKDNDEIPEITIEEQIPEDPAEQAKYMLRLQKRALELEEKALKSGSEPFDSWHKDRPFRVEHKGIIIFLPDITAEHLQRARKLLEYAELVLKDK